MTKKVVTRKESIDLDGSMLENIVYDFQNFLKKAPKAYFAYDYRYDGQFDIYIIYEEIETDKEYALRLKTEEKEKEKQIALNNKKKEKERKEYERLKKKYGDNV